MVVFGEGGCILANVVVIGKKLLYSGKSGCNRANWLCSLKSACIRAKWLYSGKVVDLGQKWLCSGKSGCVRARVVVFG